MAVRMIDLYRERSLNLRSVNAARLSAEATVSVLNLAGNKAWRARYITLAR